MHLSQNVVAARKKKGLTQEELAEITNLTVRTIQRIESGESTPRPFTLKAIAAALDINFEDLQTAEPNPIDTATILEIDQLSYKQEEAINFLQLLCLSCFSYLILPFVHFILPIYLLKKRKEQNLKILVFARKVIRVQVYWVIALNLLLLGTLLYNILSKVYFGKSIQVNYLFPFFVMYGLNALIISFTLIRSKNEVFF
ncbi:helix-turn-helix domain-containing protein [Adhaeribacter aquaticus]|uniref:helix-turn-helix domain-containing protein n=1 Tax=Adhaeribacter aquaticus TaxID=299567 RepID=UPI0004292A82|nr:helix-turn-helix transcriptional regulator [Adhaeribacter aquaticus]